MKPSFWRHFLIPQLVSFHYSLWTDLPSFKKKQQKTPTNTRVYQQGTRLEPLLGLTSGIHVCRLNDIRERVPGDEGEMGLGITHDVVGAHVVLAS